MAEEELKAAVAKAQSRLLKGTLIANIVLYAILAGSLYNPFFFIFFHFVRYLWFYIGALATFLAFGLAWLMARWLFDKSRQRLRFSGQLAGIVFALVGIILIASVPFVRGHDLDMVGYWLHARIWLDAEKVRTWAQGLEIPAGETAGVFRLRWPLTLWITASLTGRVRVDGDTRNVTLLHGSALAGHWGILVTAPGQVWRAEAFDEEARYWNLEDGVWVWRTPD